MDNIQFTMKVKDIPKLKQLYKVNTNVFEFTSFNDFSPIYSKNSYEEQIDLLINKNHYCSITTLYNFCKRDEMYKHLCTRR